MHHHRLRARTTPRKRHLPCPIRRSLTLRSLDLYRSSDWSLLRRHLRQRVHSLFTPGQDSVQPASRRPPWAWHRPPCPCPPPCRPPCLRPPSSPPPSAARPSPRAAAAVALAS